MSTGSKTIIALLPCPFCGKPPEVFPAGDKSNGAEMVECITPGCVNPHVSYYGPGVARKKWNQRAEADAMLDGLNADVDLPDTAAQDSASKSNNPAVSG